MVEKHFTDDVNRVGPDHAFSMDPRSWREMVDRTRELENALGNGIKKVEENESETVIVQRRAIRLVRDMEAGEVLQKEDLVVLRPCPMGGLPPYKIEEVIGKSCAMRGLSASIWNSVTWSEILNEVRKGRNRYTRTE